MKQNKVPWIKIKKIKKRVYCKSCGVRIDVSNFNQQLCERCGYRDKETRNGV